MSGYDPLDATSLREDANIPPDIWERDNLYGKKIGVPKEYFIEGIDP